PWIVLLPLLLLLTVVLSLGVSFLLSALTVTYRDFKFLIPFLAQVWMWASFVAFPPDIVGRKWRWVFLTNPMYGIITAWRKLILGSGPNGLPDDKTGWDPIFL